MELVKANAPNPAISGDGRYVAFESYASNLASRDVDSVCDVFVKDLQTGAVERVSVATGGAQATGGSYGAFYPAISPDGRFVAFSSDATNLVADDTDGKDNVFLRDRQAGTTELVSLTTAGRC